MMNCQEPAHEDTLIAAARRSVQKQHWRAGACIGVLDRPLRGVCNDSCHIRLVLTVSRHVAAPHRVSTFKDSNALQHS